MPDLAILKWDGTVAVVDFKVDAHVASSAWRAKERLLADAYRLDHLATFATVTWSMLRTEPRRSNARLLALHRKARERSTWDTEATVAVMACAERVGLPARLGELRRACRLPAPRAGVDRAYRALLNLIADDVLDFDRSRLIDDEVEVRFPRIRPVQPVAGLEAEGAIAHTGGASIAPFDCDACGGGPSAVPRGTA